MKFPRTIMIHILDGRQVDLLNLKSDEIKISHIAHALSMLCRWSGQISEFYSVAQHSLFVAEEAARHGLSKNDQLHALLHDASEAYMTDLLHPIKQHDEFYRAIENRVSCSIRFNFGVGWINTTEWIDKYVGEIERINFFGTDEEKTAAPKIIPMSSLDAEVSFLLKFNELTVAITKEEGR